MGLDDGLAAGAGLVTLDPLGETIDRLSTPELSMPASNESFTSSSSLTTIKNNLRTGISKENQTFIEYPSVTNQLSIVTNHGRFKVLAKTQSITYKRDKFSKSTS